MHPRKVGRRNGSRSATFLPPARWKTDLTVRFPFAERSFQVREHASQPGQPRPVQGCQRPVRPREPRKHEPDPAEPSGPAGSRVGRCWTAPGSISSDSDCFRRNGVECAARSDPNDRTGPGQTIVGGGHRYGSRRRSRGCKHWFVRRWDSLAHMRLILAVEHEVRRQLEPDKIVRIETLADVAALLNRHSLAK